MRSLKDAEPELRDSHYQHLSSGSVCGSELDVATVHSPEQEVAVTSQCHVFVCGGIFLQLEAALVVVAAPGNVFQHHIFRKRVWSLGSCVNGFRKENTMTEWQPTNKAE